MSGKDVVIGALLIFGLAAFVTTHVWLAGKLVMRKKPRILGVVALVIPPLAPIWGYREGFHRAAVQWVVTLGVYVLARLGAALL